MVLKNDIFKLIISCLLVSLLIKLPQLLGLVADSDEYYIKNVAVSIFLGLSAYTYLTQSKINRKQLIISLLIFILSAVYINSLPNGEKSDSVTLAYIHIISFSLIFQIYVTFISRLCDKGIFYVKYDSDL